MTKRQCSMPECDQPPAGRGLCNTHYHRLRTHGDPGAEVISRDPLVRFWRKVAKGPGCWMWTAAKTDRGYGAFRAVLDGMEIRYAHRFSYTIANGPIPEGMQVDHMCSVRACVNPSHLRLATSKQNHEHLTGQRSNNTSGIRGVSWCKQTKRWSGQVQHNYKGYTVGRFNTKEEAEAAVIAKRLELFTHNLNDRIKTHG